MSNLISVTSDADKLKNIKNIPELMANNNQKYAELFRLRKKYAVIEILVFIFVYSLVLYLGLAKFISYQTADFLFVLAAPIVAAMTLIPNVYLKRKLKLSWKEAFQTMSKW